MATSVTVFNAARMQAIENGSVVSGAIDGSGHLILTRHDGTTIDAGNALVAIPAESLVTFLTADSWNETTPPISYPDGESLMYIDSAHATASWPTFAGKWGTIRTINQPSRYSDADTNQVWTRNHGAGSTPEQWIRSGNGPDGWSSWKKIALSDEITALAQNLNQIITAPAETAAATTYAIGVTLFIVSSGSGWTPNGGAGTVVTVKLSTDRCVQHFYANFGGTQTPKAWMRTSHSSNGGGGWTSWARVATPEDTTTMGITGEIRMWLTSTAPNGWSFCDGGTLDRVANSALYNVIGTTFGIGDGSTTFNKPDMKGRVPVGYNSVDSNFNAIGKIGGEQTHVLTQAEMPSHTHVQDAHSHTYPGAHGALNDGNTGTPYGVQNGTFYGFYATNPNATVATNQNTGGGAAHNNLQPYITVRYIIKL